MSKIDELEALLADCKLYHCPFAIKPDLAEQLLAVVRASKRLQEFAWVGGGLPEGGTGVPSKLMYELDESLAALEGEK